jgi:3-oxoacyl-[acyl-carrier-protein] synthase II
MGVVTPLGLELDTFWANILAGKSGVRRISRFDTAAFPIKVAGAIDDFDALNYMDPKAIDRSSRCVHFALAAAKMAVEHSRLDISKEQPERVGSIGANMVDGGYIGAQNDLLRARGPRRVDPLFITKTNPAVMAIQLGMFLKARGPTVGVNSLCASSADAVGAGFNFIRLDYADVMIVGGSEASLEPLSLAGLNVLGALSREEDPVRACRPFDLNRNGFVYAEGAGIAVLEEYEHAKKRGATIYAELAGVGWSFDAYDTTAPYFETEAFAMKTALRVAGVKPEEVSYINAHGTSTKLNDASETKAIKRVFGDYAHKVPISSSKSMLGHTVAGSGVIETIITSLAIQDSIIPPTINYETPDPGCDLDYVPGKARPAELKACLSNSFGLGGQNCCIVLKKVDD